MRPALLFLALLALAACDTSQTVYHAVGVSVPARQATLARCEAQAFAQYPVHNETRFTPRRFVPPFQSCDADGNCTLRRGYFEGGDPYTVDANVGPRAAGVRACMAQQGFTRVTLPRCEPGTSVRISQAMPSLTNTSCVMQTPVGAEVVTPI